MTPKTEAELATQHALRIKAARRRDARNNTVIRKRPSVDVETFVRVKP